MRFLILISALMAFGGAAQAKPPGPFCFDYGPVSQFCYYSYESMVTFTYSGNLAGSQGVTARGTINGVPVELELAPRMGEDGRPTLIGGYDVQPRTANVSADLYFMDTEGNYDSQYGRNYHFTIATRNDGSIFHEAH